MSKAAGTGGSAYLQVTDGDETGELSQQSLEMLTSDLQEEANGLKTANTTGGGGVTSDGYAASVKPEPGVWGSDGLLAVPHVKMVLLLVCVVQVR